MRPTKSTDIFFQDSYPLPRRITSLPTSILLLKKLKEQFPVSYSLKKQLIPREPAIGPPSVSVREEVPLKESD